MQSGERGWRALRDCIETARDRAGRSDGWVAWSFDPNEGRKPLGKIRNRGVTSWEDGREKRIYFAFRHLLYALNAETGRPVSGFGESGRVDLPEGLGRASNEATTITVSTPGVVDKDLLIVGSLGSEGLP